MLLVVASCKFWMKKPQLNCLHNTLPTITLHLYMDIIELYARAEQDINFNDTPHKDIQQGHPDVI